jgi:hypothetical protein
MHSHNNLYPSFVIPSYYLQASLFESLMIVFRYFFGSCSVAVIEQSINFFRKFFVKDKAQADRRGIKNNNNREINEK